MSNCVSTARWPMKVILTALLVFCLAVSFTFAADETPAKARAMQQTGKQILDVAYEQYQRGKSDDAKATLQRAIPYRDYLSVSDTNRLDELAKKLDVQPGPQKANQPVPQNIATELLSQARSLASQGQFPQAKQKYMQAKQTGQLSAQELSAVDAELAALDQTLATQQTQVKQQAVNPEYIKFVPVDANNIKASQQPQVRVVQTEPVQTAQEQTKENYIEVVKQKQRIQQSYTKAVVNEAVAKAKEYADKQDFARARDEISRASLVVEKNKMLLDNADYTQYTTALQQLLNDVNTRQSQTELQKTEKAKAEAKTSQEQLRAQQSADKQKRIQDLLTHAQEYQEQQKYDEALAQMDTLLAIDPTNREAERNKQMLEDIINLRKQLEIKKEIGRQEEAVLTDTQRSMIPHADLITYPRNWQDIVAKRKPNVISGLSPADAAVYKQLETVVDLTALTPDTPLNEAIDIIKNSVDPPLKIFVLWKDLADNVYVEQDTVIGMQGFAGIPVGEALKKLLAAISGGVANIDFSIEEGIITVATKASLPSGKLITQVYDITELIGAPADFQTEMQTGGQGRATQSNGQIQVTTDIITKNADDIIQMIQGTIAPLTWLVNGGEGTISRTNDNKRLIISQTPQVHIQIQKLLMEDLRVALGQQVSIEARFLFVTENFLEDIGIDTNILINGLGSFGSLNFTQATGDYTVPSATVVPGSLAKEFGMPTTTSTTPAGTPPAINLNSGVGGTYGSVLDGLSVSFLLRATQAHRDAKMLTAPRVTVLSGEQAYIKVVQESAYVSDYQFQDITAAGIGQPTKTVANPTTQIISGGVLLLVTPTISADKKYVILRISANYTQVNLDKEFPVYASTTGEKFSLQLPVSDVSEIQTRVSVPDGGTLLIGGQKLGAEINKEAGVPGLSKVPLIGRLFSNRSKVKDQDVLLILVKPTIMIQQEAEREYFAPLEE